MTDDLVKRLRGDDICDYDAVDELCNEAADRIEEQQKRIEKLEYFLKVRDDFLGKHYLWQELVIALGEKKDD
jgi:hypothetical protein